MTARLRPIAAVLCAALVGLPALARADGFGWSSKRNKRSASSGSGNAHSAAPVGTPHAASPGAPGYRAYAVPAYYYDDGWGIRAWGYYGWGYYPYYGGPVIAEEVPVRPPEITSSVFLGGLFTGSAAGLDLRGAIDGRRMGVDFDFAALPSVNPDDPTDVRAMPLLNGHLTYSVLSTLNARVRVEGGFSLASGPAVSYLGPDVGASGQVALIGPLAAEASLRWTPYPASIVDGEAGLALHLGNLGLRGGWRVLRLDDRRVNEGGGVDVLAGPVLGVGLVF